MSAFATAMFRGRRRVDALDPGDRGLAYGDGLFETMRVHRGTLPWIDAHLARLTAGAARLRLPVPDAAWLRQVIAPLLEASPADAVLKLVLTRGAGGRGYAPAADPEPTLVLTSHPLPGPAPGALAMRWCTTRIAIQPALAGMKHLNRLEQVLARGECSSPGIDEGLMLDTEDRVVGATAANVFALVDGSWLTPPVDRRGVAGVARAWILGHCAAAREAELTRSRLEGAEAVFLCNAVRGILPAGSLDDRRWAPHPALDDLRRHLGRDVPAFAIGS